MSFISSIKKKIKTMNKDKKPKIIDMDYTKENQKLLNNIKIKDQSNIEIHGLYGIKKKIKELFQKTLSNNKQEINKLTDIIYKIIVNVINASNKDSALIHLRVFLENKEAYKIPRWHLDNGRYFTSQKLGDISPKFVTTLIGPNTRIYIPTKQERKEVNILEKKKSLALKKIFLDNTLSNEEKRKKLKQWVTSDHFVGKNEIKHRKLIKNIFKNKNRHLKLSNNNKGILYLTNSVDHATYHSEPQFIEPRVFLAIIPGSKKDVKDRYKRSKGMVPANGLHKKK